jgi:hypothetical protein
MSKKKIFLRFSAIILMAFSLITAYYLGTGVSLLGLNSVHSLEFKSIKCVNPVSINNAKWQVSILVTNQGTRPLKIIEVYVDEKQVVQYGLVHGDYLIEGTKLGTNIPEEGLYLQPGESENIYIWVGDNLYNNGAEIQIRLQDSVSFSFTKPVVLIRYSLGEMNQIKKNSSMNY